MCFILLRVYFGKRNDNGGGGGDNIKSKRCIAIVESIIKKNPVTSMILHPVGILSNHSQIKLEQYGPKTQEHRPISCNHSVLSHVNLYLLKHCRVKARSKNQ